MANPRSSTLFPIAAQLVLCGVATLVMAAWPPRSGPLMLVPLGGAAAAKVVPIALAGDARLLGRGPLPGSYVVRGDRSALAATLLAAGILTLAAPAVTCGAVSA